MNLTSSFFLRKLRGGILPALMLCILAGPFRLDSKPAYPGLIDYVQPDGSVIRIFLQGDENGHSILSADGIRLERSPEGFLIPDLKKTGVSPSREKKKYLFSGTPFPSEGEPAALVVLVNFNDKKFSMADPRSYFDAMLNKEGFDEYGASGSVRDYFIHNSMGLFRPHFDVYGPITLSERCSYYGSNNMYGDDMHPELMCIEACTQLDPNVDFTRYDLDGDGYIDNLFIFYAGFGEADTGISTLIWPHSANIEDFELGEKYVFDGKILNRYGMSNELDYQYRRPDGIGTFVHEFSHVLGLPDLYATTYSFAFTPGEFSILDVGSYNDEGRTPPHYSSFERMSLGWLEPEIPASEGEYTLEPLHLSNKAYLIPTDDENEFYLFENRKKELGDAFIPAEGMLVWHVDFKQTVWDDNVVNNTPSHQYVDLIEADGKASKYTRSGDAFPGTSNKTEFSFSSSPQLKTWSGRSTGYALSQISLSGDVVSFNVKHDISGATLIPTEVATRSGWHIENGRIFNDSHSRIPLHIYTPDGSLRLMLAEGCDARLPAGIYIVVDSDSASKIII